MPVDPTIQSLLDNMGEGDLSDNSVEEARAMIGLLTLVDGEPEPVAQVRDLTVPGPAGDIPVRLYRPDDGDAALPLLIWYHGGGWVIGDLESADPTVRKLANRGGFLVLSVNYRLAPEHRYPAAVEDCWAVLEWVSAHGGELGADPTRLAVGGDSAGGNLAAVIAVKARDAGLAVRHQLLIYPATDATASQPSIEENGEGYLLTRKGMAWFGDHYAAGADLRDPQLSPLFTADLRGVAPATVYTAEYDPLRDEGNLYAQHLAEAGVETEQHCYPGMIHGFFSMATMTPVTNQAIAASAARLAAALA